MFEVASPSSATLADSSIPRVSSGHPYGDLKYFAETLAEGLELRAMATECLSERKRLRVLAAAAWQIEACLSGTGARS